MGSQTVSSFVRFDSVYAQPNDKKLFFYTLELPADEASPKKRIRPVKPLWTPSEKALQSLAQFAKKVDAFKLLQAASSVKVQKNVFPRSLDLALLELDKVITMHHQDVTRKYSGVNFLRMRMHDSHLCNKSHLLYPNETKQAIMSRFAKF